MNANGVYNAGTSNLFLGRGGGGKWGVFSRQFRLFPSTFSISFIPFPLSSPALPRFQVVPEIPLKYSEERC